MAKQAAAYQQVWVREIQTQLLQLSSKARQIVVEQSDHGIPDNAPDVVISAVQEVVQAVKAN